MEGRFYKFANDPRRSRDRSFERRFYSHNFRDILFLIDNNWYFIFGKIYHSFFSSRAFLSKFRSFYFRIVSQSKATKDIIVLHSLYNVVLNYYTYIYVGISNRDIRTCSVSRYFLYRNIFDTD